MPETTDLNESHRRRLLANAQYADKLLSDVEGILNASESKSPFPKYRPDVSLHQARIVRSQISRFRDHLGRALSAVGIEHDGAQFGSLHSIRVTLAFVRIAVQEMAPEYLRGYGELSDGAALELRGLCTELEGLIDTLERNLALGDAVDLQARLDRLERTIGEAELIRMLDRIISDDELAEFRNPLVTLVEKLESPVFEIAVFGRVSAGKSSLLNHVLGTDVLPVGVNPITAVPTRIVFGQAARLVVSFADQERQIHPIEDLAQYASEEQNPGNQLGVSRLVACLPSLRLQDGFVLVDTPGLGALATAGAAETVAYLPQCDLGIVLIGAVNPLNEEDLNTIDALSRAGIPVMALQSKADLLSPPDMNKALDYTKREVLNNLGLRIEIHPVSTVTQDEQLLEDWFRIHLDPLLRRHQELAQQSIRRKAGVLRESVMTALRSKLGAAGTAPPTITTPLEETERQLRTAAGEIERSRQFCSLATDEVRSLGGIALRGSVQAILEAWSSPTPVEVVGTAVVQKTIGSLAVEAASQISGHLMTLAQNLQSALQVASAAMHDQSSSRDEALSECVREMPRFEAALPAFDIQPPWFRFLSRASRRWLTHRLEAHYSTAFQAGFAGYGRALETWIRRVLADLQRRFDARADAYRAELARRISRKSLSLADTKQLELHLAELEAIGAAARVLD